MGLRKLLEPESVAVIGASRDKGSVGNIILKNCMKSKCKAYAVNPNAGKVEGKKAHDSILNIRGKIDLAVVAVPAKIVPKVLEECGEKGIETAVIISSGFGERGEEGKKLERELKDLAEEYGVRMLGPNVLGNIVPTKDVNYSFFEEKPKEGKIAFVSQSGALGVGVLDWSLESELGLSAFISVGNKMDIKFPELVSLLDKDEDTETICLYIESVDDGREFMRACEETDKPIIVLKAGKTEEGKKASASHTGSLAGSHRIYSAAFKQSGVIEVANLEDMFNTASFLAHQKRPEGNDLCIMTNAGGPGILTTDLAEKYDLNVVNLPKKAKKEFDKVLPEFWNGINPVDILGDADHKRYWDALEVLEKNQFYDCLIVILTPQGTVKAEKVANEVVKFKKETKVPVVACFIGGKEIKKAQDVLEEANIPNFFEPEKAIRLLSGTR